MSEFGITSYGAYVPRLRIDRKIIADAHKWMAPGLKGQAKGSRAFTSWDEDAITMAVEAGRDALIGQDVSKLRALQLATTTSPYADLQGSAIITGALQAPDSLFASDVGSSMRAGTSGLIQALKAGEHALFIASDAPVGKPASVQEVIYGAGAAGFVLGTQNVIAKFAGAGSVTTNFVDHYRAADSKYEYFWEERWIRDEGFAKIVPAAIKNALGDAGLTIADIAHFVMPTAYKGAAEATAKKVKFEGAIAPGLEDGVGYTGAAHGLLMLANVLETAKAGERILVIGFGLGADALILEVTPEIAKLSKRRGVSGCIADGVQTDSYMRMLSFYNGIELEWGMRAEKNAKTALTEQYRSGDQLEGFVAGKCGACGTIQFPQLPYCVNETCRKPKTQFTPVALADAPAKVLTVTVDWLSYHPAPPLNVGFVQFDNGARLLMEMVDVGPSGVDRDDALRFVFRVKERDKARGYSRYFWKATPVTAR